MGRKKYNLCTKCEFCHAALTGKACTAGVGVQDLKKDKKDDKPVSRGQGPNLVRCPDNAHHRQKAVSVVERVEKIKQDMGAMDEKLDLITASMKKPSLPLSDVDEIVEEWTKDISEAWDEVKTRGRARNKRSNPSRKPRSPSSSSPELQQEGETKYFERKQFAPKDHKFKRSTEIVHLCVKTLEKIINEAGDSIPALKHLKFVSDKVAKGCFNFEAISGYDNGVRARVALEGYGEFAKIETDEVFGHFSVENTIKKFDSFRYNSEEGCTGK